MSHGKLTIFQRLRRTRIYDRPVNKLHPKRLNWEQIEARPRKEAKRVVKGTSKRIVVVKSPDPKVFEEAIFIVKEDFLHKSGHTSALKEAQKVADAYIRSTVSRPRALFFRFPAPVWAIIGALLSALAVVLIYHM